MFFDVPGGGPTRPFNAEEFIVLKAEFTVFNAKFIVFNAEFILLNAKFRPSRWIRRRLRADYYTKSSFSVQNYTSDGKFPPVFSMKIHHFMEIHW